MPHIEINYSDDLALNTRLLFDHLESTINKLDPSAGVCKSRAYPAKSYKHSHVMIDLWLLPKPHRDPAFTQALLQQLEECVQKHTTNPCYISIQLHYRDTNYITTE